MDYEYIEELIEGQKKTQGKSSTVRFITNILGLLGVLGGGMWKMNSDSVSMETNYAHIAKLDQAKWEIDSMRFERQIQELKWEIEDIKRGR